MRNIPSLLLLFLLAASKVLGQTVIFTGQTFSVAQFQMNLDTLIVQNCTFHNIIGEALRFDNVGYVRIDNCLFSEVSNSNSTRAALTGRAAQTVIVTNTEFRNITGTAIRFPYDGTSTTSHRLGKVLLDSLEINDTATSGSIDGTGIRIFHTDSVIIRNCDIRNIQYNGIWLGRNSTGQTQIDQRIEFVELYGNVIDSVLGDGILVQENISGAKVHDNQISNIAVDGVGAKPTEGDHGIYWQASGGELFRNRILRVQDGLTSGNPGSGISARTNAVIYANEIGFCTGNGIGYFNDHPGSGLLAIHNNVVFETDRNGIYLNGSNGNITNPASVSQPDEIEIFQNTVFNRAIQPLIHQSSPVALNSLTGNYQVAGNLLVYDGISDTTQHVRILGSMQVQFIDHNLLASSDPGFMDLNTHDFHLAAGSAPIDFLPLGISYTSADLEGNNRTGRHDAGAYEFAQTNGIELSEPSIYRAFPNPFHRGFTLEGTNPETPVQILDAVGRKAWQGPARETFAVEHLNPGIYWVVWVEADGPQFLQLVKL